MQPLTIELKIDQKKKKYVTPNHIQGSLFRTAAEVAQELEERSFEVLLNLDKYYQFIVEVFGEKFDVDTLEAGLDARKILDTLYAVSNYVLGNISTAIEMLSDKDTSKEELGK